MQRVMWAVILAGAAIIPIFVWPGAKERFRVPKEALFRAEGVVLLALLLIGLVLGARLPRIDWRDRPVGLTLAILVWTAITAVASLNRGLSVDSLVTVVASAAIFVATYVLVREGSKGALVVVLIPAVVNAALVILQELEIWNPFTFSEAFVGHQQSTALVGNPNDVGSALVAPALMAAAVALALTDRRLRFLFAAGAVLAAAGIVFSQTMTAIGALGVGLAILLIGYAPRRAAIGLALLVALGLGAAVAHRPLGSRLQSLVRLVAARDYNALLSQRVPAFLAAIEMFKERPLVGVGPGGFAYHYFDRRLQQPARHDEALVAMPSSEQFGEVHNDHLQVLAEAGLPGYLALLGALALLASTWRSPHPVARILGPALAVGWFVLALAQFPLQLAAPRLMFLHLAAVTLAWGTDANR